MGFSDHGGGRRRSGGRLALGIAVLTVIAVIGAFIGVKLLSGSPTPTPSSAGPVTSASPPANPNSGKPIPLTSSMIRIVDPPQGDRTEFAGFEKIVDGNEQTGWTTDEYKSANFGGLKPGMGVLINLGAPTKVGLVRVVVNQQGASLSLRTGTSDPGNTSAGDKQIADGYTPVGNAPTDNNGVVTVFTVPEAQQTVQYLLVWITKLPANAEGQFVLSVNEITVLSP